MTGHESEHDEIVRLASAFNGLGRDVPRSRKLRAHRVWAVAVRRHLERGHAGETFSSSITRAAVDHVELHRQAGEWKAPADA